MPCSSGCPNPGTHPSWGACLRAKRLQVQGVEPHRYNQNLNRELDLYRDARKAGLQPDTTKRADVEKAWKITDKTGTPYRADK